MCRRTKNGPNPMGRQQRVIRLLLPVFVCVRYFTTCFLMTAILRLMRRFTHFFPLFKNFSSNPIDYLKLIPFSFSPSSSSPLCVFLLLFGSGSGKRSGPSSSQHDHSRLSGSYRSAHRISPPVSYIFYFFFPFISVSVCQILIFNRFVLFCLLWLIQTSTWRR